MIKKVAQIAIMSILMAAVSTSIEANTIRKDNLTIQINQVQDPTPGYAVFQVHVQSHNEEGRTVHGVLSLLATGGYSQTEVSRCIVYIEVPAGETVEDIASCRVDQFDRWSFALKEIYPFIPETNTESTD